MNTKKKCYYQQHTVCRLACQIVIVFRKCHSIKKVITNTKAYHQGIFAVPRGKCMPERSSAMRRLRLGAARFDYRLKACRTPACLHKLQQLCWIRGWRCLIIAISYSSSDKLLLRPSWCLRAQPMLTCRPNSRNFSFIRIFFFFVISRPASLVIRPASGMAEILFSYELFFVCFSVRIRALHVGTYSVNAEIHTFRQDEWVAHSNFSE